MTQRWFGIRWRAVVSWLRCGCSGILPATLWQQFGPVGWALPLARQVAEAVGPWLRSVLEARQRWGGPALVVVADEVRLRLWAAEDVEPAPAWLASALAADLWRLVRLVGALHLPARTGWLDWEVRYWALAVTLARLGQVYHLLERAQGRQAAQQIMLDLAGQVRQQALAPGHGS